MIIRKYSVLILVFFLIFSFCFPSGAKIGFSTTLSESLHTTVDTYWSDGFFEGTWGRTEAASLGDMSGFFNLGRNPSTGVFKGSWNHSSEHISGSFQGYFRGGVVFGRLKEGSDASLFLGFLDASDQCFTVTVFILGEGTMYCKGLHVESFLPSLTGRYGVGARLFHLVDESRPEYFTDDPDDVREMMMQVWYPIDRNSSGERIEYMDAPTFQWLKGRSPVPLFTIPDDAYLFVRPYTKRNVTIVEDDLCFPVIMFSHGYDGVYQIYTSLIEDLVSHGFVVASINHPYVAGMTVFPDGRTVGLASGFPGDRTFRTVVTDCQFGLSMMEALNHTDTMFQGRFDLSKVGMYGHSFGGGATAVCCYEDERFDAGLTLDGVNPVANISQGIDKPFCLLLAEARYTRDPSVEEMWDLLRDDAYKVGIVGSTHYGFTDVGILLQHLTPLIPPRLLGFGSIAPKQMVDITRSFERVFFNVYLKGYPLDDLIDLAEEYEEVLFEYK